MDNVVTVSGMFGKVDGQIHTYFSDSPVVIDFSGLEWPANSPFNVVTIDVVPGIDKNAEGSLEKKFVGHNAPFYDKAKGYINGARIVNVEADGGKTVDLLVVTSYSVYGGFSTYMSIGEYVETLKGKAVDGMNGMISTDKNGPKRIVKANATQTDCDELIKLCRQAYGPEIIESAFRAETGGQSEISFDISSALQNIWAEYDFVQEVEAANDAVNSKDNIGVSRSYREYSLRIFTEYLSSDDGGVYTKTQCEDEEGHSDIPGGQCVIGQLTEMERRKIENRANADVSALEHKNVRNGDASTKPTSSPERVGKDSITSWVDVSSSGVTSIFYPAITESKIDDKPNQSSGWSGHAPIVLRDSVPYADFLFLNRRGAIETCSGQTLESMGIDVETTQYALGGKSSFSPSHTQTSIGAGGRRSWRMSSGYVTREWAEWWVLEFLAPRRRRRHWMLYEGQYVPVIVEPLNKSITIYDRSKQQMPHVDFKVTLALEG